LFSRERQALPREATPRGPIDCAVASIALASGDSETSCEEFLTRALGNDDEPTPAATDVKQNRSCEVSIDYVFRVRAARKNPAICR